MSSSHLIRHALPSDDAAWRSLWQAYCEFYQTNVSEAVTSRTWSRILNPDSGVVCMVAEVDGQVYGFANCVVHENTWELQPVCYLEDLFVTPAARGHGLATALIEWLQKAVALGNENYPFFADNNRFDNLRCDLRFIDLLSSLKQKWEERR